jgi:8-amino-7-oxononanoate synthase
MDAARPFVGPGNADASPLRAGGTWLERWLATNRDLVRLQAANPMVDRVIEAVDGRRIRIAGRWLVDFASCNYLGFDLDPAIIEGIAPYLRDWGTHPSWSRMLGSPELYERIEDGLAELLGAADVLALPTLTHIHGAVLPILAAGGAIFLDARAHKTIYDGCTIARGRGAALHRFAHGDADELERLLRASTAWPKVICMDGVNSMTGNPPDVGVFARLAREHGALLYLDDAHGFGVIGEREAGEPSPYGRRGNGVVRHFGESYDDIVLTAGLSKAYSSLLAFVTCSPALKRLLKVAAPPYLYSGPSPVASLASALLGLDANALRGDRLRARLWEMTARVLDHLRALGATTTNISGFPLIQVPIANPDDIDEVGRALFDRGIYVTLAFYPGVPRREVGIRVQLTAANTDEQVSELIVALHEIGDRFGYRPAER